MNPSPSVGGLAISCKSPHTSDASPDTGRFQPSPSYTLEVRWSRHPVNLLSRDQLLCFFWFFFPFSCRFRFPVVLCVRPATLWCMTRRSWLAGRPTTPTSTALVLSVVQPFCLFSMWKLKTLDHRAGTNLSYIHHNMLPIWCLNVFIVKRDRVCAAQIWSMSHILLPQFYYFTCKDKPITSTMYINTQTKIFTTSSCRTVGRMLENSNSSSTSATLFFVQTQFLAVMPRMFLHTLTKNSFTPAIYFKISLFLPPGLLRRARLFQRRTFLTHLTVRLKHLPKTVPLLHPQLSHRSRRSVGLQETPPPLLRWRCHTWVLWFCGRSWRACWWMRETRPCPLPLLSTNTLSSSGTSCGISVDWICQVTCLVSFWPLSTGPERSR